MLRAGLRRLLQRCRSTLGRAWTWLGRLPGQAARVAFGLVCWLIVVVLLMGLLLQVAGRTDPKIVVSILALLLPAAFLGAYGREVASRIKKLGPFELFEVGKETDYLAELPFRPDLDDLRPDQKGEIKLQKFSERDRFAFERGDRYLNYLEYSGSEPTQGRMQERHWRQLLTIGRGALGSGEWTKAIHWLERLEKLSHRSLEPSRIDGYLAMSHIYFAIEHQVDAGAKEKVERHFQKAEERLSRLAREQNLDYLGYFWLAYVQDELGRWYEAVQSNEAALKRRPRYAPAKYNAAVSYAKLGQYRHAHRMLGSIEPEDQYSFKVLEPADQDNDLWDAVIDPYWNRRMRYVVRRAREMARPQEG